MKYKNGDRIYFNEKMYGRGFGTICGSEYWDGYVFPAFELVDVHLLDNTISVKNCVFHVWENEIIRRVE